MVQFTSATLLALAGVVAAGAHRVPAHAALHRRGGYPVSSPAAASETFTGYPTSSPLPESSTCTEEESTTPAASTSTYVAHSTYPASTPVAESSYPASTPVAESSYPASTPVAESSYPASTPVAESSYPASTPVAESSYPASTPVAESSYPASTPVAESSYPASTPVAESSYPASSPAASSYPASSPVAESSYPASAPAAKSTSTSTYLLTTTHLYTVSGGSPSAGGSSPEGGCGTVTVTVTAGQAPSYPASKPSAAPSYPASKPSAAPSYPASKPSAAQSYPASKPSVAQSYPASSPANYPTSAPSSSGSYSGGKRGLAVANVASVNVPAASPLGWAFNWAAQAPGLPEHIEYVPMLKDSSMVSQFQEAAKSAKYVMGMNEVDMTVSGGGSALPPSEAASMWKQYIQPLSGSCSLGAPSVTSDNSPDSNLNGVSPASGTDYLTQFAQACDGCTIDFACAHWYGQEGASGEDQAQLFITYMENYIQTIQGLWGKNTKVWVTEFSALPQIDQDTQGINAAFMQTVLPWLDNNDDVERYSYYAAMPNLLMNSDGTLTSIGETYCSA